MAGPVGEKDYVLDFNDDRAYVELVEPKSANGLNGHKGRVIAYVSCDRQIHCQVL